MQAITNEANGIVKVDGDTWTAIADDPIDAGEKVIVIKRHSTILEVKRRVNKYGSINVNDYFALIVVTFIALTIKIIPQQKLESLKDLVSFSGLCSRD